MASDLSDQTDQLFKLRTITYFLADVPDDADDKVWERAIRSAASFLQDAAEEFETHGFEVQTLRIATRALDFVTTSIPDPVPTTDGEDKDNTATTASPPTTPSASTTTKLREAKALHLAHMLEALTLVNDLSFLNLGTSSAEWLLDGGLSSLASTLSNTSFSFSWQPHMGTTHAHKLAREIFKIGKLTEGSSNFRFGVAFNCNPGIPYFPAAHPPGRENNSFAIGTENSGLLYAAMEQAAEKVSSGGCSVSEGIGSSIRDTFGAALKPVQDIAAALSTATGVTYQGIDTSFAPALQGPDLTASYDLLGLGSSNNFGGPGTIATSEGITGGLKSIPGITKTGFCGLMLPVMEDAGLAELAASGKLTWQTLLFNSTVCGVGLDTVPIPGIASDTSPEEAEKLVKGVAGMLLDVAAVSERLKKPLVVRLLPVPGAKVNDYTAFCSPYLVESRVMRI